MIVIMRQCRMNLSQGQVRMLKVNLFRTESVRECLKRHFHHLDVGIVDPGNPLFIMVNMLDRHSGFHRRIWGKSGLNCSEI